jgi:hypothetical protein
MNTMTTTNGSNDRPSYGWNQAGREKAKKMGILPFTYWVLLTTYIFFALLEIGMCLKHIL